MQFFLGVLSLKIHIGVSPLISWLPWQQCTLIRSCEMHIKRFPITFWEKSLNFGSKVLTVQALKKPLGEGGGENLPPPG